MRQAACCLRVLLVVNGKAENGVYKAEMNADGAPAAACLCCRHSSCFR